MASPSRRSLGHITGREKQASTTALHCTCTCLTLSPYRRRTKEVCYNFPSVDVETPRSQMGSRSRYYKPPKDGVGCLWVGKVKKERQGYKVSYFRIGRGIPHLGTRTIHRAREGETVQTLLSAQSQKKRVFELQWYSSIIVRALFERIHTHKQSVVYEDSTRIL